MADVEGVGTIPHPSLTSFIHRLRVRMIRLSSLTRRYLAVFAVAAGATICGQVLVQFAYRRQATHDVLLGRAVRQRSLAERMSSVAFALGQPTAVAGGAAQMGPRFQEALRDFRRSPDFDVASLPGALRDQEGPRLAAVTAARTQLVARAADIELLMASVRTPQRDSALVAAAYRLSDVQRLFGSALNDFGREVLVASNAEMASSRRLEFGLTLLMIGTLAVGALVIVRPATRNADRLVAEVLGSRERLAKAHAQAQHEREFATSLVASAADGIFAFDDQLCITEWNPSMERWTGIGRAEAIGRALSEFEAEIDWGTDGRPYERALLGEPTMMQGQPGRASRGHATSFFDCTCVPVLSTAGSISGGLVTIRDVSERVAAATRIGVSEARFRTLFDQAAIGIAFIDDDGVIHSVNPAWERIFGFSEAELRGRVAATLSPPEDAEITRGPVGELRAGVRDSVTVEKRFMRSDGTILWGSLTVSRFRSPGERTTLVGMLYDITARKELERRLSHQAFHDPLTGLANRIRLLERIEHVLAAPDRPPETVAVIYVDLDDFKKVNDSLGHAAGDTLLRTVSERLLNATRGSDTVARLGGDEFAILLENVRTDEDVLCVADRVVRAMRAPVMVEGKEVFVGASVGIARGDASCAATSDALLRNADVAMYRAKGAGKGRYAMYEHGMQEAALERLELEAGLRHAIERDELLLHFQPIVELEGERIVGVEALVRWQHPTLGLLPPLRFISLAEETGLIVPLGRWVLNEACRNGMSWLSHPDAKPDARSMTLTVNVSPRQIHDGGFVDDVRDALAATGFPAEQLLLELTESIFIQQEASTLETLHALKALGVRLGIDDFGTGYSSLGYLQQFPLDVLKIDKRFIDGMSRGGSEAALARTIIALGDSLSLRTVAEGVARPQQQEQLIALGCTYAQGFLFAQPLGAAEIDTLLRDVPEILRAS
jgi:diguanylate cyclase (GGDEF)-like protein/PAS domain S-box-containing protein